MKNLFFTFLFLLTFTRLAAVEGMWIPMLLQQLNEEEMHQMGMRLTAEDIYSINQSSLKDAIVLYGRGCTGSIISPDGLVLTNHHCGFGVIQRLSSLENNYQEHGFWAMSSEEELPAPGLTVTLMKRMDDVTDEVLNGIAADMPTLLRDSLIRINIRSIERNAADTSGYTARIRPFYHGNQFYLFFTETFRDVRLVGAPPSSIGKFGGDTDNWMWPRHTGDFALFRIYTDSTNRPANYAPENIPYTPAKHIPISLKGVEQGDFTFVFGYPGRTQQFLPAVALADIIEVNNPVAIKLRGRRIDIMNAAMDESELVRLQYAAKTYGISNAWKRMIGENRGIRRLNAIEVKRQREQEFLQWASSDPELQRKYGGIIPAFEQIYQELSPINLSRTYLNEAGLGIEVLRFASQFAPLVDASRSKDKSREELDNQLMALRNSAEVFFRNYQAGIDQQVMAEMLRIYNTGLDPAYQPSALKDLSSKYKFDYKALAADVFKTSVFTDQQRLISFLENYKPGHYRNIEKDPVFMLAQSLTSYLQDQINEPGRAFQQQLDSLQRLFVQGLMEMQPQRRFYPDANLTLRVTYGLVEDYFPRDAVRYDYFTTSNGILEKEDPEIYDYLVDERLKELFNQGDFGPYAHHDGQLRVCFIASNHTTGGNSGSPVLNANGHLVGVNFDRNWEGTMSDLMYDPEMGRNISLDIRYCLFIIDKFAGAGHLLNELTLIK